MNLIGCLSALKVFSKTFKIVFQHVCQDTRYWKLRPTLLETDLQVFPLLYILQMYGHFDSSTSTWIDGLFTKMLCSDNVLKNAALKADKQCDIQNWFVMNGNINNSWVIPFESLLNHTNEFVIGNGKKISVAGNLYLLQPYQLILVGHVFSKVALLFFCLCY